MLLVNRVPPDVEGAVDERVDEGVGHAEEKYGLHQAVPELQQRNEWDYHRLQIFDLPSLSVKGSAKRSADFVKQQPDRARQKR